MVFYAVIESPWYSFNLVAIEPLNAEWEITKKINVWYLMQYCELVDEKLYEILTRNIIKNGDAALVSLCKSI